MMAYKTAYACWLTDDGAVLARAGAPEELELKMAAMGVARTREWTPYVVGKSGVVCWWAEAGREGTPA